jgi:hypothetical protein
MVRRVTGMKTSAPKGRGPGRSPATTPKATARTVAPKKAGTAKRPMAPSGSFTSKEALRVQIEELERANATLRTKSRDAGRASKIAADRIAELEAEVARLQKRVVSRAAAAKQARKPALAPKSEPGHSIDPGDAVPPGVAPEEPVLPDHEVEQAPEDFEEHLASETPMTEY